MCVCVHLCFSGSLKILLYTACKNKKCTYNCVCKLWHLSVRSYQDACKLDTHVHTYTHTHLVYLYDDDDDNDDDDEDEDDDDDDHDDDDGDDDDDVYPTIYMHMSLYTCMYVCLTPSLCLRTEQSFWWRRAGWAINVPCPNNFQLRS